MEEKHFLLRVGFLFFSQFYLCMYFDSWTTANFLHRKDLFQKVIIERCSADNVSLIGAMIAEAVSKRSESVYHDIRYKYTLSDNFPVSRFCSKEPNKNLDGVVAFHKYTKLTETFVYSTNLVVLSIFGFELQKNTNMCELFD